MRIVHIVLPGASAYERKCQRADQAALAKEHEVIVVEGPSFDPRAIAATGAVVAHVYASGTLIPAAFRGFPIPYVSSVEMPRARWAWRRPLAPAVVFSPLAPAENEGAVRFLPEPVEEAYWHMQRRRPEPADGELHIVGSFSREPLRNLVEQTLVRIHRFRSDIQWRLLGHTPTPGDLAGVDLWVDPAIENDDFDGFVAEALVAGLPVVASRTPINERRLEKGRSGGLFPTRDPNELTHAILTALFKQEVRESRGIAARQTASRFHARQRIRILLSTYEALVT